MGKRTLRQPGLRVCADELPVLFSVRTLQYSSGLRVGVARDRFGHWQTALGERRTTRDA